MDEHLHLAGPDRQLHRGGLHRQQAQANRMGLEVSDSEPAGHETLPVDLNVEGFFYHLGLVNKTDDPHLSLTLGAG